MPQRSRHSTGAAPSEEANELGGLGTPTATNLKYKDNKPALLRAQQLGVRAFRSLALRARRRAAAWCVRAQHRQGTHRWYRQQVAHRPRAGVHFEALGVDVAVAL